VRHFLKSHPRPVAVTFLVALLGLIALWLQRDDSVRSVRASYDYSHAIAHLGQKSLEDSPVVIVYLDYESYQAEHQKLGEPWNRGLHARLVQRLTQAGVKAIVFDIIFSEPGEPAADKDFIEVVRGSGRVFLAAELNRVGRDTESELATRSQTLTLPQKNFLEAAAGFGLANLTVDDDFVVRRYFSGSRLQSQPSLTAAVGRKLNVQFATDHAAPLWLRYYGRALTIPHVSYTHALDPAAVGDEFFRGKIVFIGARPMTGGFTERRDEFRSPFPSWRRELFMPAVEVHATQMLNLLRDDWLHRLPPTIESLVLLALAALFGAGLFQFRPLTAAGLAFAAEAVVIVAALVAFARGGLWFPWLIVSAVQIPVALSGSVLFQSVEWYRARRRFEAQRRESETKIREQASLIDKAQDAILVEDLQERIVYANASAARLYGWAIDEFTRDGVAAQLFAPCRSKVAEARRVVRERGEWQGELEQATRSGLKLLVESRWTLIRDEHGAPKSVLVVNTDVTEKKRLEAQFLRTQRLEAVWSLAGGMAHDLNNALSPVLMGIQRLRKSVRDEETQRMLGVMEANTHRGADMVKQVLTFSRGRGDERELLNPGQLLREMERVATQTFPKSIRVATLAPRDLWPVLGNATQLHQVLLNLCLNARDAMPSGGELTLAADNVELDAAEAKEIPGASAGEFVMLLVADTGTGIAPQVVPHLFEPFFTTKAPGQGTGLGLSTMAHIVRGHRGFVNVKTEAGAGTTFEVYLPRATAEPREEKSEPSRVLVAGRGEFILLIDDEMAVRDMMRLTLEENGYRVLAASDGPEAISLLARNNGSIRLALVDRNMPVMDGLQTIVALRKQQPGLPIILMSGDVESPPNFESGLTAFLRKPFREDQLLQMLHDQLHLAGSKEA
jgi:two-component system, cell cycle sensor histidine kinase and response regulator CckA